MIEVDKGLKRRKEIAEKIIEKSFFSVSLLAVVGIMLIGVFIFIKGMPAIFEIGFSNFIFGQVWNPSADLFGIFPMIVASLLGTFGALIIGVPLGVLTAVLLSEVAPIWVQILVRPAVDLLAGVPSVLYGFFGLVVIVPMLDDMFGGGGNSLLAVMIILAIMILPTIVSISESAIRAVPKQYKEGSLALGCSHIYTIFKVMIPAAKSGILSAIVLGTGRAIGETMAVILVAGNSPLIPGSLMDRVRTLTANIAIEMGYAYGLHQEALFATGVVLFVFIMILNIIMTRLIKKH
ncbi:MAG: phosphate ABC transporter permease subunit PstC [Acidaminobacteraceae bacterium]